MNTILITDTHFGVRQNSLSWFRSQMRFIEKEFIPLVEALDGPKRIVHLGDVFDIRGSVSTYIATEVRRLFERLGDICPVTVIAGNHDFYSPTTDEYCALELVLSNIPGVDLVLRDIKEDEYGVYIPWYVQERQGISELSKEYAGKTIYTHADLVLDRPKLYTTVISGHIHIPLFDGFRKNLGSCFPLTFADSNSLRYVYIFDGEMLRPVPNTRSIRFWRLYGEDADWGEVSPEDYIEWYIDGTLLCTESFAKVLSVKRSMYKELTVVPQSTKFSEDIDIYNYNIETTMEQFVPEELRDLYNKVSKRVNEGKDII